MSVLIRSLRPGDRLFAMSAAAGEPDGATLISWSVPHPTYPGFALVVWRLADGRLSFDALHPDQHDPGGAVVVEQSEDERLESLRRAIDPGPPRDAPSRRLTHDEEAALEDGYDGPLPPGLGIGESAGDEDER